MTRFTQSGPRDTAPQLDGDTGFRGVVTKGEPDQLPAGALRAMTNGTCRDGTARTRAGSLTPHSLQVRTAQNVSPGPYSPDCFGSGLFSDPLGSEWLLMALTYSIWRLADGHTPVRLEIPEPLTGPVKIVQAFQTVLVFRGSDKVPWAWNGDTREPFREIDQNVSGILSPIPNGPDRPGLLPVNLQNRLIVPHSRSQIAVSDIFDYTHFDSVFADFNLTGGNDDVLTGLLRYSGAAMLVFNTQSIQILTGIEPTLTALSLEPVNDSIGCVAGGTIARLGSDVLWLSDTGVFPLREVGANSNRETPPMPISDPIEPTIERINWRFASKAVAAVWGDSYYLAVPLDDSPVNNALLVYDGRLQAWQGIHTFPLGIDALHVLDFFGRKRLHAVHYISSFVSLLYEGRHDRFADGLGFGSNNNEPVSFSATTRSYPLGDATGRKHVRRLAAYTKTWHPSTSANLAVDGVNESTVLASAQTKDRTKSMKFGEAAYVESNAGHDHGRPYREDYSLDPDVPFDPDGGIDFELEQHHRLQVATTARGRYTSITLENTEGTLALAALTIEGQASENTQQPAP